MAGLQYQLSLGSDAISLTEAFVGEAFGCLGRGMSVVLGKFEGDIIIVTYTDS